MDINRYGYSKAVILALLVMVCLYTIFPNIRNIIGIQSPETISSVKDSAFYDGNYVTFDFDCVLDAYYNKSVYWYEYNFGLLRLADKEEYVYASIHSSNKLSWNDCDYFPNTKAAESVNFRPDKPHRFIGRVEVFEPVTSSHIQDRIEDKSFGAEYQMINKAENTNTLYYVDIIETGVEVRNLIIKVIILAILVTLLTISIKKICVMKRIVREQRE